MRSHEAPQAPRREGPTIVRTWLALGFRPFFLCAVLLAGVGEAGRLIGWVTLTTTLGPTAPGGARPD
ncbi:hypothetical protein [Streptomyces sp. NPDC093261]|uniref:hypothetical protein n=1 Tax=Streptomyces sp. NPDC093261 TaxID=3366037 RepID=UPI00382CA3DC